LEEYRRAPFTEPDFPGLAAGWTRFSISGHQAVGIRIFLKLLPSLWRRDLFEFGEAFSSLIPNPEGGGRDRWGHKIYRCGIPVATQAFSGTLAVMVFPQTGIPSAIGDTPIGQVIRGVSMAGAAAF